MPWPTFHPLLLPKATAPAPTERPNRYNVGDLVIHADQEKRVVRVSPTGDWIWVEGRREAISIRDVQPVR